MTATKVESPKQSPSVAAEQSALKLSKEEVLRYSRHLIMPEVGMERQLKLKAAKVLLISHCRSGKRSAEAVEFLLRTGFRKVWSLKGGILAWSDQVDPSVPKY